MLSLHLLLHILPFIKNSYEEKKKKPTLQVCWENKMWNIHKSKRDEKLGKEQNLFILPQLMCQTANLASTPVLTLWAKQCQWP